MKKIFFFFFVILMVTGCTINNLSYLENDEIVDQILSFKSAKPNTALRGYKIYLPSNMTLLEDTDSNNILSSEKDKYYLYIDLVSYYNKTDNNYKN
jgi:hypothetical protein